MQREHRTFSVWDYVVFSLVLVISAGIGVYYGCTGGKQRTTREFLMADRQMKIFPVSLSLLASFMSAIMLLGTPAEMYLFGTQYMVIAVGYCMLVPVVAFLYIPVFYNLNLTSAYEYLEIRYKKKGVRLIGSGLFIIQMTMYMAIVLYAPSLALNAVTGFNVWISVFSVGCVCTFYTALGGIKAVMWTDAFQIGMMLAGLLAVLIQGCISLGGFQNVLDIAYQGDRIHFFDFNPDPGARHTVWSLTFGAFFTWLAINGVNQSQVQRCLTCPTLRDAQIAMLTMAPGLIMLLIMTSFCGLVMYAHYQHCDPLMNKEIIASDQLLPLYVMDALGHLPGVPGLFVACLMSGTLSTISSGLNSLAAVTMQDFIRGHFFPNMPEEKATLWAKLLALIYGVVMIALTFVAAQLGSVLQAALALFGILGGPLLGVFTLGMFFPQANWKGAVTGAAVALPLCLWIGLGAVLRKPPLPMATRLIDGCPVANVTLSNMTTVLSNLTTDSYVMTEDVSTGGSIPEIPFQDKPFRSSPDYRDGWDRLYSLSYMWYSLVAVLVVCGVGLIVSYFTGGEEDVDSRAICPVFDIACPYLPETWRARLRCGVKYSKKDDATKAAEMVLLEENIIPEKDKIN